MSSYKKTVLSVLTAIGISSCSWSDPMRVEEDFGKSVRHMVDAQKYDRAAAENPALLAPDTLDGQATVNSLERYRKGEAKE